MVGLSCGCTAGRHDRGQRGRWRRGRGYKICPDCGDLGRCSGEENWNPSEGAMRLAVISNMSGCKWAGSETVWHLAALRALQDHHEVSVLLHPDIRTSA